MGILEEDIERVRTEVPILDVIGQYVEVKRQGQSFKGLCPFHAERSPSFSVSPTKNLYYCFGCGAAGDVITFVCEFEHIDFPAAVERLAGRINLTVRYDSAQAGEVRERRSQLVEVMKEAVEYFAANLSRSRRALAYLRDERGISDEEIAQYRLGWALAPHDGLLRHFKGVEPTLLADCGLVLFTKDRPVDQFRERVMFPIFDAQGDPIGFGGRFLPDHTGPGGKYKNSPEGRLYNKSRVLYGLNWAKRAAVQQDEIIVCEGYTDVIGLARCGFMNAVATCGTALTGEHARLLRRFASRVVLAYDPDEAGEAATDRFFVWEQEFDFEVVVATLPVGQDPGELARTDRVALKEAVERARPLLDVAVERVLGKGDPSTVERRLKTANAALDLVDRHPSQVIRAEYLNIVATRLGLDADALRADRSSRSRYARRERPAAPTASNASPQASRNVETEAIRVLIHHPEQISRALEPWLFTDPTTLGAWHLLGEHGDARIAVAVADEKTRMLLHYLVAVEDPVPSGWSAYVRLLESAAVRILDDLRSQAGRALSPGAADDLLTIGRLQLMIDQLRAGSLGTDEVVAAAAYLRDMHSAPAAPPASAEEAYPGYDPDAGW